MSTGCLSLDERTREALLRMIEDAAAIRRYVERAGGAWIDDEMAFDAVCKRLEDIGEQVHTSRVALEFQQQHPEIPWRSIKGFRDVAVHAYADVDRELVREIVFDGDLDDLVRNLERAMSEC
jgi:uncharacterized protein with HEPN domain